MIALDQGEMPQVTSTWSPIPIKPKKVLRILGRIEEAVQKVKTLHPEWDGDVIFSKLFAVTGKSKGLPLEGFRDEIIQIGLTKGLIAQRPSPTDPRKQVLRAFNSDTRSVFRHLNVNSELRKSLLG